MPTSPPTVAATPAPEAEVRRANTVSRWLLRISLGVFIAAALLLLVGWLSLHWLILPHIEDWRSPIEARASRLVGAPVTIGSIRVRSRGWVPVVDVDDIRVLDAQRQPALTLPHVQAAFSLRSLLRFEVGFEQLVVSGADLEIRRDRQGRIRVAGLDFGQGAAGKDDGDAADWLFRQRELAIRGATLRWIDEARAAPPLALSAVELVIRNGVVEHDARLDATPPPEWGDRFSLRGRFRQPLLARSGDWRRWSGSVYGDLPRADVHELRNHVSLPFELGTGNGALRAWLDVKSGEPVGATVDLALRAVQVRLDPKAEALDFASIEGRIGVEKKGDRIAVAVRRFGFATGDGLVWPKGDLDFAWRQPAGGDVDAGEFSAARLDIGVMASIASRLPIGTALRELLAEVRPEGIVSKLSTRWDGPVDAPERYRVQGVLQGLSLVASAADKPDAVGRPGLRNATIVLDASEGGGRANLTIEGGALDLPGVVAESVVPLDRFAAKVEWKIGRAGREPARPITVQVDEATFANPDLHGEVRATWHTGPGSGFARGGRFPGSLDLDGRLFDARAARVARYLPLGLSEKVRSYVGRAVRGGTIKSADLRVRGDLWDFPFAHAKSARDGEFRAAALLDDVTFAYVPGDVPAAAGAASAPAVGWPAFARASGELLIERNALELTKTKAMLGAVAWSDLHGRIAALGDHAVFEVDGNAHGALADMLRFVNGSPVGRWLGGALATTTATGPAELRLALSVPLDDPEQTHARGTLGLAGNDVRMTPDTPLLGAAKARIDFTDKGFVLGNGSARMLGGDASFEGGSSRGLAGGDEQRFTGRGTVEAGALRRAGELGFVASLARVLEGQTAYVASLAFVDGRPQLDVQSDLAGMAVDLPSPLGKAAAARSSLRVVTAPEGGASAAGPAPREESLQVAFAGALQARFVRVDEGERTRVVRGSVRVVESAASAAASPRTIDEDARKPPVPSGNGVAATIELDRLDLDAWRNALARLEGDASRAPAAGATPPLVFDGAGGEGYVPDALALRVGELTVAGRKLEHVTAGVSQSGGLWRANVDADELDGYLEVRPPRRGAPNAGGLVYARLARLSLPKGEDERVESLLDDEPTSVPALDIVVDDFELRGKRLGRLEIEASNRGGRAGAREWDLSKFNLTTPDARLAATGTWGTASRGGADRRSSMDFILTLADSGALLERLGLGGIVRGGKGTLAGEVSWPGSPLEPDYARMTGRIKVAIDSGQFLKASPGAARLLGVLSLQSLPRRLLLDFRDVFEEGFAFDNVVGDVGIGEGRASTNNLRMRGPAAAVLMEGSADLEKETEDLRVLVVPEINAGTASLAYAVVNPAIGLGTFLAQYFLRKPLAAANTREFRITGPWDDPKVERVERTTFAAEEAESPPAAAAASLPASPAR